MSPAQPCSDREVAAIGAIRLLPLPEGIGGICHLSPQKRGTLRHPLSAPPKPASLPGSRPLKKRPSPPSSPCSRPSPGYLTEIQSARSPRA